MSKIIRLAIDGNEANVTNRVGSNFYAFELLQAIYDQVNQREDLQVSVLLSSSPMADLPKASSKWKYQVFGPVRFWTQWALPIHLFWQQAKYDVFFTPGHYAPRITKVPYICSVMDLAFLYYPDQFKKSDLIQLKDWTKYSVKNARKVLAISQATKNDVIKNYHKKESDVFVAYPALASQKPTNSLTPKKVLKKFRIDQDYLLYVGTIQPRKNLINLIEAYESVNRYLQAENVSNHKNKPNQQHQLDLVIAGKIGWLSDQILAKIESSPFSNQIKLLGFVSTAEKEVLYSHAQATILVGLYEGFGLPPLESMAMGTIPIVSNNSSLPEVVGRGGISVDPNNVGEISKGIKEVLNLTARQKAIYRKQMREQVKKFSWQKSASILIEELINIANYANKK